VDALADPDDDGLIARLEPLATSTPTTLRAMEVLTRHWTATPPTPTTSTLRDDPGTAASSSSPGRGRHLTANPLLPNGESPPLSVFATGIWRRRLYMNPDGRADYLASARVAARFGVGTRDEIIASLDRYDEVIWPVVGGSEHTAATDELAPRSARSAPPSRESWRMDRRNGPPLRDPLCLAKIGSVDVTFDTTWGTQGRPTVRHRHRRLDGARQRRDLIDNDVGATAGDDPNAPKVLGVDHRLARRRTLAVVFVQIEPSLFHTGSQEVDWAACSARCIAYDPMTLQFTLVGALGEGTVELDEAGKDQRRAGQRPDHRRPGRNAVLSEPASSRRRFESWKASLTIPRNRLLGGRGSAQRSRRGLLRSVAEVGGFISNKGVLVHLRDRALRLAMAAARRPASARRSTCDRGCTRQGGVSILPSWS
jgi:hypothetical protein